jgi:HlyD family secretion protein
MKPVARVVLVLVLASVATAAWLVLRSRSDVNGALMASGTVEATDADLGFQIAGRVLEISVEEGDAVTAGTRLARLDTRELDAALTGAQAELEAAEARLVELERGARPQEVVTAEAAVRAAATRAEEARSERERASTLFGGGAISRQALDRAESAYQVAAAALEQAREQLALVQEGPRTETVRAQTAVVARARANVERAEATLANAVVTAPFDGVVTIVHREPGESVTPGAPAITLLAPDDRWVRIYVPEDQMGRVQLGLRAAIVSDTYPDRVYDGEVTFVGSEAEFTPRNVQTAEERTKLVYPVRVRVDGDPGFELKPGIPVDVTLLEPEA